MHARIGRCCVYGDMVNIVHCAAGSAESLEQRTDRPLDISDELVTIPRPKLLRLATLLQGAYARHQSRGLRSALDFVEQVLSAANSTDPH